MANNGPDSNGSQFYIIYSPQSHLNNKYTIFGMYVFSPLKLSLIQYRIIDGFDTLDKMERVPVGKKSRPLADIVLNSVTIHANPIAG